MYKAMLHLAKQYQISICERLKDKRLDTSFAQEEESMLITG